MKVRNTTLISVGLMILVSGTCKSQISEVQYKDWEFGCSFKLNTSEIIINSEEEFKQYTNCLIWNFDFDRNTIIGLSGFYCASSPDAEIRILKDDKQKKYIIELNIYRNKPGANRMARYGSKKVIYTDKLQADYEILIETNYLGIKKNNLDTYNPQESIPRKRRYCSGLFRMK